MLAIDDIEASLSTARMVRQNYPHVPIYARARDRRHVHRLMDEGIKIIRRETFLASHRLDARGAARPWSARARGAILGRHVPGHGPPRLYEDYKHYTNVERLQERAKSYAQELEELFAKDAAEHTKAESAGKTT